MYGISLSDNSRRRQEEEDKYIYTQIHIFIVVQSFDIRNNEEGTIVIGKRDTFVLL